MMNVWVERLAMTGAGDMEGRGGCGWRSSLCLQLAAEAWCGFFFGEFLLVSAPRIKDFKGSLVTKYEACELEPGS